MGISPIAAWLASLREWAADPGALIHTVQGKHGSIALFPADVTSRTDDELLEFIRRRCNE
jgi:hypothetical protein